MGDLGKMGVSLPDLFRAMAHVIQYKTTGMDRSEEPWMNDPAHEAGLKAVEGAIAPGARMEPTASGETAHAAGLAAVDKAMDDFSIQAWKDRMRAGKVSKAGEAAVGKAADEESAKQAKAMEEAAAKAEADRQAALTKAWTERMAFDKSTKGMSEQDRVRAIISAGKNYPGGYGPREAQLYAQTAGPEAVARAITPPPQLPAGFYPLTPPGTTFGPHSVVNPETMSTQQPPMPAERPFVRPDRDIEE